MRSRWRFWVELFDQKEAGTSLALFRIALGLVTVYSLLSIAGAGLVGPLWTDLGHGGMRRVHGNWMVQYLGGPTPGVVWGLWSTALVSALAFTAGVGGRILGRLITLVLLQSYNGLITVNPLASGGYDLLMTNALWIMVFAEPMATLSVSARMREGRFTSEAPVSAWPRYVLIVQLLIMYTMTGLQKTALIWGPGGGYTALYWVSQDPTWMRFESVFFAWITPLFRVGTALTWHWEQLSLLLLLWFYFRYTRNRGGRIRRWALKRDWRIAWAAIGVMLHVGILLMLNVGPFSWISLSYYLLLWTPQEWSSAMRRYLSWRQLQRS